MSDHPRAKADIENLSKRCIKLETDNKILKALLNDLAEAAENMLELLEKGAPIDGLLLSNMAEWDDLIKEAKS